MAIPILNENLITICEKYGYNIPKANEQVLNRYIKDILKDLSEQLPSLKEKVPTKLTMKQKTQKTFMDYIKLSSEEIADEIAAMSKKENDMW